jgi:hypothetical protein
MCSRVIEPQTCVHQHFLEFGLPLHLVAFKASLTIVLLSAAITRWNELRTLEAGATKDSSSIVQLRQLQWCPANQTPNWSDSVCSGPWTALRPRSVCWPPVRLDIVVTAGLTATLADPYF